MLFSNFLLSENFYFCLLKSSRGKKIEFPATPQLNPVAVHPIVSKKNVFNLCPSKIFCCLPALCSNGLTRPPLLLLFSFRFIEIKRIASPSTGDKGGECHKKVGSV